MLSQLMDEAERKKSIISLTLQSLTLTNTKVQSPTLKSV